MGWEPIETAPKDGTKVFLWLPSIEDYQCSRRIESKWGSGFWLNEYGNGPAYNVNGRPNPEYGGAMCATWELIKPSHWMHIPDPPA